MARSFALDYVCGSDAGIRETRSGVDSPYALAAQDHLDKSNPLEMHVLHK